MVHTAPLLSSWGILITLLFSGPILIMVLELVNVMDGVERSVMAVKVQAMMLLFRIRTW